MRARAWWVLGLVSCLGGVLTAAASPVRAAVNPGTGSSATGRVAVRPGWVSEPVPVHGRGLRVRSAPDLSGVVLGLLYPGDRVRIVSEGPPADGYGWELVQLAAGSAGGLPKGWVGWVASRYVARPLCPVGNPWVPWECLPVAGPVAPGVDLVPGSLLPGSGGHGAF